MPIKLTGRVRFNFNDNVTVTLTAEGLAAVQGRGRFCAHGLKGNVLTTQLWVLMQELGDKIYMGGPSLFEDNVIELADPQKVEDFL